MQERSADQRRKSDRSGPDSGWGSQQLWDQLAPCWPELSIEVIDRLASTNGELVERLRLAARNARERGVRADDLRPTLLVAVQQTQGRGRLGRSWQATPGSSLTFSFAVPLQRADWSGLSLAVGVAVADALDTAGDQVQLKWPNDLWRMDAPGRGRKLGGVLIEAMTVGEQRMAVVGVGLNVRPQAQLDDIAACTEFWPAATPSAVLSVVGPALGEALYRFDRQGFGAFAADFARRDLLAGQPLRSTDPACPEGLALGVAEDGALRVLRDGVEHRIVSGEVSVRPLPPAAG